MQVCDDYSSLTSTFFYIYLCFYLTRPIQANRVGQGSGLSVRLIRSVGVQIFTARCTIVQSAVLRSHVVRLSVCNVCDL